jgi:hypothetical protein
MFIKFLWCKKFRVEYQYLTEILLYLVFIVLLLYFYFCWGIVIWTVLLASCNSLKCVHNLFNFCFSDTTGYMPDLKTWLQIHLV